MLIFNEENDFRNYEEKPILLFDCDYEMNEIIKNEVITIFNEIISKAK